MTQVDDLRVGHWVCITGCKHPRGRRCATQYNGRPCKIEAISLPFVAVYGDDGVVTIDVRVWELTKVTNRRYIRLMRGQRSPAPPAPVTAEIDARCIRCGGRLVKRLVKTPTHAWVSWCENCERPMGNPVPCGE